jgi:hypothetical protein
LHLFILSNFLIQTQIIYSHYLTGRKFLFAEWLKQQLKKMAGVAPRPGRALRWMRCSHCLANRLLQKPCVPGFNWSLSPGKISWLFDIWRYQLFIHTVFFNSLFFFYMTGYIFYAKKYLELSFCCLSKGLKIHMVYKIITPFINYPI